MDDAVAPSRPEDRGHRCLRCGYNLTGIDSLRCPECGEVIEWRSVVHAAAGRPVSATPWDDPHVGPVAGFCRTAARAWFAPGRLAAGFLSRHRMGPSWTYTLWCWLVGWAVYAGGFGVWQVATFDELDAEFAANVLAVPVMTLPAMIVCEVLIAAWTALLVRPAGLGGRYHVWRGLTHYTGGWIMLGGPVVGLASLAREGVSSLTGTPVWYDLNEWAFFGVIAVDVIWWWTALGVCIVRRGEPNPVGKFFAILAIPLIFAVVVWGTVIATVIPWLVVASLFGWSL